jgi:hypothetical protein
VLLRTVAAQTIGSDFKLASGITKGDEGKAPEQDANGVGGQLLQSTDIDGLRVITEPVAKIDLFDIELFKLVAAASGDGELDEDAFDVTVTPVDVVNLDLTSLASVLHALIDDNLVD